MEHAQPYSELVIDNEALPGKLDFMFRRKRVSQALRNCGSCVRTV